jgi:hypothetical protein
MRFRECGLLDISERPEGTVRGFHWFRCRACRKQFKEAQHDIAEPGRVFLRRHRSRRAFGIHTAAEPARSGWDGSHSQHRVPRGSPRLGGQPQTNRYPDNRAELDHSGIKGRYQPMRGFKSGLSAASLCRNYDELPNFLRRHSDCDQHVLANHRRTRVPSGSTSRLGGVA